MVPLRLPRHQRGLYTTSERVLHWRLMGGDPLAAQARAGRLRLPPGARRLASASAAVADNERAIWLFCGADSWTWWRDADGRGEPALCLPPGEHPDAFNWSPCRHHDVLLVQAGMESDLRVRELAEQVALAEPRTLVVAADWCDWNECDMFLFDMPAVRLL